MKQNPHVQCPAKNVAGKNVSQYKFLNSNVTCYAIQSVSLLCAPTPVCNLIGFAALVSSYLVDCSTVSANPTVI